MAELKPYPEYKDSGVEWIGEIPEDWDVAKLKYYLLLKNGKYINNEDLNEEGPYYVKGSNGIIGKTNKYNLSERAFLIGRVGSAGEINLNNTDEKSWISDNVLIGKEINAYFEFLYYFLVVRQLGELADKTAQPLLTGTKLKELYLPVPSINLQKSISEFLDRETILIGSLISDKKCLLNLLEEKRQAIITETVTKGLDPNVKMKDSGVEWIGEIPEHWKISKIKYISNINSRILSENTLKETEINYIDIGNVSSNGEIITTEKLLFKDAPSRARRKVNIGDTIISTVRTYLRAITTIDKEHDNTIVSTGFAVITPKKSIINEYLGYYCRTSIFLDRVVSLSKGVSYPAINSSDIGRIEIAIPPFEEQESIVQSINTRLGEIDSINIKIKKQMKKLKEYRESLIYEAVTGKIDLREYEINSSEYTTYEQVAESDEAYMKSD